MAPPTEETRDKLSTRVLKRLNAFTELPVVYELSYVCFWGWQGLIGPLWALLLFAWWFIEGRFGRLRLPMHGIGTMSPFTPASIRPIIKHDTHPAQA